MTSKTATLKVKLSNRTSSGESLFCSSAVPRARSAARHFRLQRNLSARTIAGSKSNAWYDDIYLLIRFDLEEPLTSRLSQLKKRRDADQSTRVWDSDYVECGLWLPESIHFQAIASWAGRWAFMAHKLIVKPDPARMDRRLYDWKEIPVSLSHAGCSVELGKTSWRVMMKIPWKLLGKKGPRSDLKVILGRARYVHNDCSSWPICSHFGDFGSFADLVLEGKKRMPIRRPWLPQPLIAVKKSAASSLKGWISSRELVICRNGGMFPVVQRLQDGSLGLVARFGAGHLGLGGRLEFLRSLDEGQSWSKPMVVSAGGLRGDHRCPGFGQMRDGTLVVGYCHCEDYDRYGNYVHARPKDKPFPPIRVRRSVDMGKTWSKPITLADLGNPRLYAPYGKIVVLPDGTALMAVYGGGSYLVRSHDNGRTWQDLTLISPEHGETALLTLRSGKVLAALRRRDLTLWLTESEDSGRSWSAPRQVTREKQAPADLIQLKTGEIILNHGNRFFPFGVRSLISRDEGRMWQPRQSLRLCWWAAGADCGYPSSAEISRGRIFTAYYAVRSRRDPDLGIYAGGLVYSKNDLDKR